MSDLNLTRNVNDPTKFTLKFGGKGNDINAATYGALLINTVAILEEANKELKTGASIEIRVKQEREGSYLVDLAINALASLGVLAPLMTPDNIKTATETAKKIIATTTTAFKIWKELKGEKPSGITSEGDNVVIVTGDHNTIVTDRATSKLVLENKRSQDAFADSFQILSKDSHVDGFEILDSHEQSLFESEKDEFAALARKPPRLLPDKHADIESVNLSIIRPSFERNLTSDFIYRGIRIAASITDEVFWEGIDRGDRFGKGDVLFVDLEISKVFSKPLNTYENKGYTILKVHAHIPRPAQPNFLED